MRAIKTKLKDLLIFEIDVHSDDRGWFAETYKKNKLSNNGVNIEFIQDNHSYSAKKNTLRGIHFQKNPVAQSKLIRCTKGAIIDTVIDLRKGSDTFKQWFSIELSEVNKKQLYIPKGFGHAFLTLTDDVEVQYKVDQYYSKEHDRSIRYDDPELNIDWGIKSPILSPKDSTAPLLCNSDVNFSIKVLVTGANGQLGYDVVKRLNELNIESIGVDKADFDITDQSTTHKYLLDYKPDVVVHCAAYTAVDKAETERDISYAVNVEGTRNIAAACKMIDAKMVYISTDYVFDGDGLTEQPENKLTNPVNFYGYTKALGENIVRETIQKHFIVRTSWVYGINGNNFVNTMLNLAKTKIELTIVDDQIGAPTYAKDLAHLICDIIQTDKYDTYHGVNDGYCSWYDFAREIFRKSKIDIRLKPIPTSEYHTAAKRPLNSKLSVKNLEKHGFKKLPSWENALSRYLNELRST